MTYQELKNEIGENLYNQLSNEDRDFMLETAGSLDFGHPVDLEKMMEEIRRYKNGE